MSGLALIATILLSMGSLAWGYEQEGFPSLALFLIIFGLVWLLSQWRKLDWFSSLGLFLAVLFAAIGLWFEFDLSWMIAGCVFALFAWDMTEFRRRMRYIAADDDIRGMERRHVARITLMMVASLFLITIALVIKIRFTFEWGILLVIVILLGVGQLVAWLRR